MQLALCKSGKMCIRDRGSPTSKISNLFITAGYVTNESATQYRVWSDSVHVNIFKYLNTWQPSAHMAYGNSPMHHLAVSVQYADIVLKVLKVFNFFIIRVIVEWLII